MTGIFKNNRRIPVKDTHTGKVYRSKYQAGKALAPEFGLDTSYKLAWYRILIKSQSGRFIEVKTGKPVK